MIGAMNSSVPPVRSSWGRIDGWLREHAPATYENLAGPADPAAIESAQVELGLRFPVDLTDSLLCHDGLLSWDKVLPGPPPQSVAQIVAHGRMRREIDEDEDLGDPSDPGAEPWWHPLWIPWAQSDGNAQVIDMREGPQQGRLGTACHDDTGHFDDGWPSLGAYLAEVADVLDHGGLADGCAPYLTCDGELWWDLEGETELNGDPLTPAPTPARAAALAARASWSLTELLGEPVRRADEDRPVIEALARDWSVVLPPDYVAVASAYGDTTISDHLYFFGARGLRAYGERNAPTAPSRSVPHPVLPTSGGVLAIGHTIDGDRLFLVPHPDGSWTVSAFRRGWADWHDTGIGFGEWFRGALAGVLATDWLPEWEPGPHPLEVSA